MNRAQRGNSDLRAVLSDWIWLWVCSKGHGHGAGDLTKDHAVMDRILRTVRGQFVSMVNGEKLEHVVKEDECRMAGFETAKLLS